MFATASSTGDGHPFDPQGWHVDGAAELKVVRGAQVPVHVDQIACDGDFGDPVWVVVADTQVTDETVLPEDLSATDSDARSASDGETALLQTEYGAVDGGANGVLGDVIDLANGDESVIRSYDYFEYTGAVDAATGEALSDSSGRSSSVGDFVGSQTAALVPRGIPTVLSIARVDPSPTNLANVRFTVTFSEAVTGVNVALGSRMIRVRAPAAMTDRMYQRARKGRSLSKQFKYRPPFCEMMDEPEWM